MQKIILAVAILLASPPDLQAQVLDKLEKKVERKVNQRIDRRTDRAIDKGLDKVEDAIDGKDQPGKTTGKPARTGTGAGNNAGSSVQNKDKESGPSGSNAAGGPVQTTVIARPDPELDFTGKLLYSDDFAETRVGGLPRTIISSSGGEVVQLNGVQGFRFYPNSNVLLNAGKLPDNFALEFDLTLKNVPPSLYKTFFNVYLQSLKILKHADPKNQFGAIGFSLWGDKKDHQLDVFNKKGAFGIEEKIPYNIAGNLLDKTAKFVLLRHKDRLRVFINGEKLVDSPNLLEGIPVQHINFRLNGTSKEDNRSFIISQVKLTAITPDLRSLWESDGKFSTSDIYFSTGSAEIKTESREVLQRIASILSQDVSAKVLITGHTDNVGDAASNQKLSEKRAESVKDYLHRHFDISPGRLLTTGKGASQPVAANTTEEGRAQNRRVEFERQ